MNKKVISAILAGAMAISTFGIVASAADEGIESKNTLTATANLNSQKINAKIPAAITAALNPYKAVITADANAVGDSFADGVASPVYEIKNLDTAKGLNVSVTPSITKTNLTISEKPIAATVKEKTIFAWLNTTTLEVSSKPLFRNSTYDATDKSQAVFKEEGTMTKDIMSIEKSSSGYFRIQGDVTAELEEGESWTAKDSASFSIILDLAASAGEAKNVKAANIVLAGGVGTQPTFAKDTTSYDVPVATAAAALTTITVTPDDTAVTTDLTVYWFVNNEALTAGGSPATAGAAVTCSAASRTAKIAVGDVITVILVNDTYTQAYTFNIVAAS